MTNSTRLIGIVMTVALWAGMAAGQGMTGGAAGDDLPPDLTLPSQGGEMLPSPAGQTTNSQDTSLSDATQQAGTTDGYYENENCDAYLPKERGFWTQLAPIESTGTWLRRGFWYAETDAVIANRLWSRKDQRLAAEDPNVKLGPSVDAQGRPVSLGFNPLFLNTNRILILNGALPGQDVAARGTLGNFLFRDDHNRDHTIEFTAQGGGTWEQERTMSSVAPRGLFVPFNIAGNNIAFDASTTQSVDYASDLDSFELNYRVRARLGHDQLIMDANGDWHRAADAGFEREYLVGLRFMELGERFDWSATDIGTVGANGDYRIRTDNELFGYQMGTGVTYQAPRFSVGTNVKGGVFVNRATGESILDFTANDTNDFDLHLVENQLSFVGEFKLQGKYHLLPNVSLRAAWEMMLITSAALAPRQSTFTSNTTYLNTTGNPFYQGASFGCDFYW
jgi:hypothetical protein